MGVRLVFSTSSEIIRIPADSVVCIEAEGNYSAIRTVAGDAFVLSMQLGQVEKRIMEMLDENDHRFIRIGKSLIVNSDFIAFINPARQKLVLSDCNTFRHEAVASKDALKALKELLSNLL